MPRFLPLALALLAVLPANAADSAPRLASGVLVEINHVRAQHGLAPLRVNAGLASAAVEHSREMLTRGFFAHPSSNGGPFWERVSRHYGRGSFAFWSVGENLAWASPGLTPALTVRMWLASPDHRRNLLNPRWREVGLASWHAGPAPGVYGGRSVTVLTADFGVRR